MKEKEGKNILVNELSLVFFDFILACSKTVLRRLELVLVKNWIIRYVFQGNIPSNLEQ